jgi:hypothetical protein
MTVAEARHRADLAEAEYRVALRHSFRYTSTRATVCPAPSTPRPGWRWFPLLTLCARRRRCRRMRSRCRQG